MQGLPSELIYVLIFGAALLFNFVMRKAARRQQEEAARHAPPEEEIPEEVWNPAPVAVVAGPEPDEVLAHVRREARPLAPPPRTSARKRLSVARQSLFGARWDIQEEDRGWHGDRAGSAGRRA